MKVISCPKCEGKWDEDTWIEFHIQEPYVITRIKIQDLVFCPICFFYPDTSNPSSGMDQYNAKLDRVILTRRNLKIESIVIEDEFGRYIDMDIDDFKELKVSGFDPNPDYDDSPTDLRDDWPHASNMPG